VHPDPLDPPFLLVSGPDPPPDLRTAHIAVVGDFPGPNDEGSGTAAPAGRMDPDPKGIHLPDHRGQPDEAENQESGPGRERPEEHAVQVPPARLAAQIAAALPDLPDQ